MLLKQQDHAKKSILFMAQLPPPVHGAALRNQSLVDSELINSRFNLHVMPLRFIDDMKDLGKFSLKKIRLTAYYSLSLLRILIAKKIDLVYFTMSPSGGAFYRDILFLSIIKLFGKKRILHFRVRGLKKTAGTQNGKYLVKYALRGSDIICLSNHHFLDLAGLHDKPPFLVPNGIKIESEYVHLASQNVINTVPKILFLSNLSVKKGIPELIKALGILKRRQYHFSASIVGGEWDMSYKDVTALVLGEGLQEDVIVQGPKYGREKFEFIAAADIFVLPTWFELFPGVILEAMQFGKAIVSTVEGSIPEIIDHNVNGLLVENRNVEQLADAISSLIDNPEKRKEMGAWAKDKFFHEFTLPVFEARMCSVYGKILND